MLFDVWQRVEVVLAQVARSQQMLQVGLQLFSHESVFFLHDLQVEGVRRKRALLVRANQLRLLKEAGILLNLLLFFLLRLLDFLFPIYLLPVTL